MTLRPGAVALVVPDYDEAIRFFVTGVGFHLLSDEDQRRGKR